MIIFTNKYFDIYGRVVIRPDWGGTRLFDTTRRVSRSAALNGEAYIDDAGFSHGDRQFTIQVRNMSEGDLEWLHRMQRLYGTQRCTTQEGVFEGAIESITTNAGRTNIRFLPTEKLST